MIGKAYPLRVIFRIPKRTVKNLHAEHEGLRLKNTA